MRMKIPGIHKVKRIFYSITQNNNCSAKTTMEKELLNPGKDVTLFLDRLNHPLRKEIEMLRICILSAGNRLSENVKWNGPNYSFGSEDRITMKIQPPGKIQLIFHRGAKVKEQPVNKLINDNSGLLEWKENDRAVATFNSMAEIEKYKPEISKIVKDWIEAAK